MKVLSCQAESGSPVMQGTEEERDSPASQPDSHAQLNSLCLDNSVSYTNIFC